MAGAAGLLGNPEPAGREQHGAQSQIRRGDPDESEGPLRANRTCTCSVRARAEWARADRVCLRILRPLVAQFGSTRARPAAPARFRFQVGRPEGDPDRASVRSVDIERIRLGNEIAKLPKSERSGIEIRCDIGEPLAKLAKCNPAILAFHLLDCSSQDWDGCCGWLQRRWGFWSAR